MTAVAPAPWDLKFRAWSFLLSPLPSKPSVSFPAGWSVDCQAEALAEGGEFIGGPGVVVLMSYSETPVGPYDELIYSPGKWKYADGSTGYRITRIYVSSKASTENGRRNWNIPKQVANFSFTQDTTAAAWTLSVSTLEEPDVPFFKIVASPVPIFSRMGFSMSLVRGLVNLIQPPIPKGEREEEIATDKWALLRLNEMKGTARLCRMQATLDTGKLVGNGRNFPAVSPWTLGTTAEGEMVFGVPELKERMA